MTIDEVLNSFELKQVDELEEYRKTGLTPQGVQEMLEHGKVVAEALLKYQKEEKEGLLIRLPFPVGTQVFCIEVNAADACYSCNYFNCEDYDDDRCSNPEVEDDICPAEETDEPRCNRQKWIVYSTVIRNVLVAVDLKPLVGKSVFLTEDEAQAECDRRNKEYQEKHSGSRI